MATLYVELSDEDNKRVEEIKEAYEAKTISEAIRTLIRKEYKELQEKGLVSKT